MIHTRKNNKKESTKCALACISRVLSHIQAFKIALRITAVSCSTHQQKFKQQLTPWSVTSEVSASDPSHGVECHGPKQHNYQTQQGKDGAEPGRVLVGASTLYAQDTWGTVESNFICYVPHVPRTRLTQMRSLPNGSTRSQQHVSKSTAASRLE